jgi:hypothetical protein
MVLTAYFVLSPATGFFATVAGGITSADLTPASGRQDHTSLPSAPAPLVSRHRASTASRANVRDDRETPLYRDGMAEVMDLIWGWLEAESFFGQDWTGRIDLIPFNNFVFTRMPDAAIPSSPSPWQGGKGTHAARLLSAEQR